VRKDAISEVMGHSISKVLGRLPIEGVGIVQADVTHKRHIARTIHSHEHVVIVELIFDGAGRDNAIVRTIVHELRAS